MRNTIKSDGNLETSKDVIVLWNVSGETEKTIDLPAGVYTVYDFLGGNKKITQTTTPLIIKIGPCPIFIKAV